LGEILLKKEINIDDNMLFEQLGVNHESSFKDLIKAISSHVYNNIKLDGIFKIEYWLESLLESEIFLSTTKKRHRDHLLHACRIAVLGERILNEEVTFNNCRIKILDLVRELIIDNSKICGILESYEIDLSKKDELNLVILKVWYIAALFHDIGYIYESFMESWKNVKKNLSSSNFKDFQFNI
jgi:hypothetical protein